MGVVAASAGFPSGQEHGLVGGDEAASERSTISRENCANGRTERARAHSVPDGNRLLGFAGDLRRRQVRRRRLPERRAAVVCCTSHCHGGGPHFTFPFNASVSKRECLFARPRRLLCSLPPWGEPSNRDPWISQGDGDHARRNSLSGVREVAS